MAVYVDEAIWQWHGRSWCHMVSDDIDELHRFAYSIGIQRSSYQGPPRTSKPHYDLTAWERRKAISLGAVPCGRTEIISVLRRLMARDEAA